MAVLDYPGLTRFKGKIDTKFAGTVAAEYSASATYKVGDFVIYKNNLYRCNTTISTAEAWTAAHWTAATAGDEISELNQATDYIETSLKCRKYYLDASMNSSGSIVTPAGNRAVVCFEVEPGIDISLASGTIELYAFFENAPQVDSQAYSVSVAGSFSDLIVPNGCNWLAVRCLAANKESIAITPSIAIGRIKNNEEKTADIEDSLMNYYRTGKKRLFTNNEISGTRYAGFSVNIPKGPVLLTVSAVTSTDTDSTTCAVIFYDADSNIITAIQCNRGSTVTNYTAKLSKDCVTVIFYASNTTSHSIGDIFTFSNVILSALDFDKGINILLMGDSIFGNDGEIAGFLNEKYGSCTNGAFGGTRVSVRIPTESTPSWEYWKYFDGVNLVTALCSTASDRWDNQDAAAAALSSQYDWILDRLATLKGVNMSKVDLLITDWGTNDYTAGATIDDITTAYKTVIDLLQTRYPKLRILISTPIWRYWGTESDDLNGDNRVINASTLKEIVQAIEQMAHDKRITVFNAYQNMPLSYATASTYFDVTSSDTHTHINSDGNKVYAGYLSGMIKWMFGDIN